TEELMEEVGVERVAGASCEPEQHREACVEGLTAMQSVGDNAARVEGDGGHRSPCRAGDDGSVARSGVGDLGGEGGQLEPEAFGDDDRGRFEETDVDGRVESD